MPLLKPLPGDLADRQTILELKINHSNAEIEDEVIDPFAVSNTGYGNRVTDSVKTVAIARTLVNKGASNVAPFMDELELIRREIERHWVTDLITRNKVEEYDKLYDQLEQANSQLWDLEDKIRALRSAPDRVNKTIEWLTLVADTSMLITDTNDKRSEIIKSINLLWNYSTQEKMY